jgi:phosphotriesterase-related protein
MAGIVQTVRGRVKAAELGVVLPHEHLLIDLVSVFGTQLLAFDFQLMDRRLAAEEARRFVKAGGGCIVDVTTDARMGRQPDGLLEISESLDCHVIMGCGWYRNSWYGPEVNRMSAAALAEGLVREIESGVNGTGIRPGVIGEIGADSSFLTAAEERVLRAAARAHLQTDLPITLHARASRVGMDQLDVLEEERVDLRRVIVGHCDTYPDSDYHEAVARRGAWVQFDTIRGTYEDVVAQRSMYVIEAIRRGFIDQLLLSHDVCALSHLRVRGGTGYDYLLSGFVPLLQERGLADEQVEQLTTRNPQTALSFERVET